MSYLFFAFWVLASYVRVHIPRIRLQLLHRVHSAPPSPHVHNNSHPNNTPSPLHLPSVMAYSIMMKKPTQPWWGWGVHAHPFHYISTITYKVVVFASAERSETLPLFLLYPYMYSLLCDAGFLYHILYFVYVMECRSRIHEHTISLRFLRIILRFLTVYRLEVSVYCIMFTVKTSFKPLFAWRGGGVKGTVAWDGFLA